MFSGIVECQSPVLSTELRPGVLVLHIARPKEFTDLKPGDSVAVDGVCLTVEAVTDEAIRFALGAETLAVTGWTPTSLGRREVNLERSLKIGDRLHGHLVSGHVSAMGEVASVRDEGEWRWMRVEFPVTLQAALRPKGSVAVNGVSLTVNRIEGSAFEVGLIPETLRRTNLSRLERGARVTLEPDHFGMGLRDWLQEQGVIL